MIFEMTGGSVLVTGSVIATTEENRRAGPRGVHRAGCAVSGRADSALLPHARFGARRRGPGAGDISARMAWVLELRGAGCAAHLAVPHRDDGVPARAGEPRPSGAARRAGRGFNRPGHGSRRRRRIRPIHGSSRFPTRTHRSRRSRRGTASGWPWSRRCRSFPRVSARF